MLGNLGRNLRNAVRAAFGYRVLDDENNRRRAVSGAAALKTEDQQVSRSDRRRLAETARDANRNFSLAAFALRKHFDFVCTHNFQCRSKDKGLRRDIESYIADRSKAESFDVAKRHPLDRWLRIVEGRAVCDGDIFGVRLQSGHMQGVESHRCDTPDQQKGKAAGYPDVRRWNHGVYQDDAGAAMAYAFFSKAEGTKTGELDQILPAATVWHHGYFDRLEAARGNGLINSGLEALVDTYEIYDYAKAKAKVQQLFALAIYQDAAKSPAPVTQVSGEAGGEDAEYEINFGKGPIPLILRPGDRAEFLSAANGPGLDPKFLQDLVTLCLAALDIPYCFWDPSAANYNGGRNMVILYVKSAMAKRKPIQQFLADWTAWQLERAFVGGDLLEPSAPLDYAWLPTGVPFWNPAVEVNAAIKAIEEGLDSRQRVVAETLGRDWLDVVEECSFERETLESAGLKQKPVNAVGQVPGKAGQP